MGNDPTRETSSFLRERPKSAPAILTFVAANASGGHWLYALTTAASDSPAQPLMVPMLKPSLSRKPFENVHTLPAHGSAARPACSEDSTSARPRWGADETVAFISGLAVR